MNLNRISLSPMKGFTLVELMVALTLGVLLSFGLIQVLQSSRTLSNTELSLSRVQEIGRFAMNVIAEDLRMTGFHGCADPNETGGLTVMATTGTVDLTMSGFEVGDNGTFAPALGGTDTLRAIQTGTAGSGAVVARPGSDVIRVRFGRPTGMALSARTSGTTMTVDANSDCYGEDDLLILSNCTTTHVFRNTADSCADGTPTTTFAHAASDNNPSVISPPYGVGTEFYEFNSTTYFVGDTGRDNEQGDDVFALYRVHTGGNPEELVEGVEFLQLQYGQRISATNTRYVDADTAALDFGAITTVRVGMLIRGVESALTQNDTRSYDLAGATIPATGDISHAGGRYLRKPFVATIRIRNRRAGANVL